MKKTYISPTAKTITLMSQQSLLVESLAIKGEAPSDIDTYDRAKGTAWDDGFLDSDDTNR